ncbi:desmoglein-2-like protein [Pungitius pungitius]|uniref:desmoglein-2-like protein n=1 Tax=Pungitius pungitius TaxID=134920 RepID=UPI002E0F5D26
MNMAKLSFTEVVLLLLLVLALILSAEARENTPKTLRRMKREWILPPTKLWENIDYTGKDFIAKIRSDWDTTSEVQYSLSGPGADLPPINLFMVDPDTGFLTITGVLDREKYPSYNLTGIAKFKDGTRAEEEIPLTITVLDQNDNPPRFERHSGNVKEASKAETFVMQIVAKDDDQAGTINSEISYSIISQEPAGDGHMFTIDRKTGKIHVKEATLDRETHDFYTLIVKGIDLGGAAGGLTATGTVEIKILDINDNRPILEKSEYSGSVDENVADVVVMRIKALDKDLRNTDNWLTVFSIASGNEDNLFSIETDKETNEGILKLIKPVDFEDLKKLELGLLIENVSPFVEGGAVLMNVGVNVGEGGPIATGAAAGVAAGVAAGAGAGGGGGLDLGVEIGVDADLEGGVNLGSDAGLKPGVGPGSGVGLEPGFQPGQGTKPKPNSQTNYLIKIAVNNMPESPAFMPDTKSVPVSENPNQTPDDGAITVFTATDPDTGKPAEDVSYAKAYDPDNWFTINEKTAEIKLNKAPDRESPFLVNGTYIAKILAITKDMPSKTATGTIAIQVNDYNDHCPTLTTSHSSLCSNEKTISVTGFDKDASPNAAPFTFRIIAEGTRGNWDVEVINATSAALHSRDLLWPGTYKLQVEVLDAQGLSCQSKDIFNLDVCICEETEDCTMAASRLRAPSTGLSASAISVMLMAFCLLLFIPLILLFCRCRGDKTIFPDQFKDLPFGTKEHLIPYHTEGRGEDKKAAYAVQGKDSVWEYHFEGSDSSAGSVGCCSLLGHPNLL